MTKKIEELEAEFNLKQRRLELESALEQNRFYFNKETRLSEFKGLEENELVEIFELKKKRLKDNVLFLEKQKEKQEEKEKKLNRIKIIALSIGLTFFLILVISFFLVHRFELISLSIVCTFLSGIWFYTNWKNLNSTKVSIDNIDCIIKKGNLYLGIEQPAERKEASK